MNNSLTRLHIIANSIDATSITAADPLSTSDMGGLLPDDLRKVS